MATRLGDAAGAAPAWSAGGAAPSDGVADAAAPRTPVHSHLSVHDNPLQGVLGQSLEGGAGFAAARANPLSAPPTPPPAAAAGRAARINAARRKSDGSSVFTWKRAAIGASVIALCAVVALAAGLAGGEEGNAAGSNAGGAAGTSGASGASGAAGADGSAGDVDRISLDGPDGANAGIPGLPGNRGSGSADAGFVTTAEITALVNGIIDPQLATLQGTITSLNGEVTSLTTDLTAAQADLAAAQGTISAQGTDLAAAQADLATAQGTIATQGAALATAQTDLTTAQNTIDAQGTALAAAQTTIAAQGEDLAEAQTTIAAQGADLAAAQTALTAQAADLAAAQAALATAQADLATARADLTTTQTDLAAAQAALAAAQADVTAAQAGLAAAQGDVSAHAVRLDAAEDSLDTLDGQRVGLDGEVAQLRADLDAINLDNPLIANAAEEVERLRFMLARIGQVALIKEERDEARVRQEGNSGVASARGYMGGSHPWHEGSTTNSGRAFLSIHDHADIRDTVGMGELSAVLNGVEFWTRHNDYRLRTPDETDARFKRLRVIDYPAVPPSVTACADLPCEVAEMQAYFDAWTRQDDGIRDYKPYFKPVLSYLEGWYEVDTDLTDPFASDRHTLEADSWEELYLKWRYLSSMGRKNSRENISFQPSRLWEMKDGLEPVVARWQYRIAVQPLAEDLELKRLFIHPDLHAQMQSSTPKDRDALGSSRAAHFGLNTYIGSSTWSIENHRYGQAAEMYVDTLMAQVSGLNNHRAGGAPELHENVPDSPTVNETAYPYSPSTGAPPLDTTYYNRMYRTAITGAMGRSTRRRGWHDASLWVASTTHPQVAPLYIPGVGYQRNTYAVPLEVIFTTPLTNWDPYGFGYSETDPYRAASEDGRTGDKTDPSKAYMGASRGVFFRTPAEFFDGFTSGSAADTTVASVGVVSPSAPTDIKLCAASGHWIFFPEIAGVSQHFPYAGDRVRQRYPVAPVHQTPKVVWQEVKALQAIVSTGDSAGINGGLSIPALNTRRLRLRASNSGGLHQHDVYLYDAELAILNGGGSVTVTSRNGNMHTHEVTVQRGAGTNEYLIVACDGNTSPPACSHDHPGLYVV